MEKIKITIDNRPVEVDKGTTVLEAASRIGIKIPKLCYMHLHDLGVENKPGACRICVVEIEGRKNLVPSCKQECAEGMVVKTHTYRVLNARRTVMELILSNHPNECLTCSKSGDCELQSATQELGIREMPYKGEQTTFGKDISPSLIRDMNKCIMCRRCENACSQIQSVGTLSATGRGFGAIVSTAFGEDIVKTNCVNCGQCVAVCPTGALAEHSNVADVLKAIADPSKTVVVQTAPAVRVGLGQDFGYSGKSVTNKMVAALRQLGFDYVFDTDFAADLTIMEEGTELLERLSDLLAGKEAHIPLMTSCCPGWISFVEKHYPEILPHLSTAKSPQQMFGAIAKNFFAPKMGIDRKNFVVVSVMPCVAKKYERAREEFSKGGDPDVNISITTRELAHLIRYANINFAALEDDDFDSPLGESTGAGVIFGNTGGVIEAAVRTAYEIQTKKPLPKIDFTELRGFGGIRSATIDFDGIPINIGIAHSLSNARRLIEDIKAGKSGYHAIEVMACPGGCIGGGGQPYHKGNMEVIRERWASLYAEDKSKKLRKSHDNPFIKSLYNDYLGKPNGHLAHELLHTAYYDRKPAVCPICLPDANIRLIRNICKQYNNDKGELINILHATQSTLGFLPAEVQEVIAYELDMPRAEVYGVVSFYSFFTMTPKGKYPISVCMGTACYVRGAEKVLDEFRKKLGIGVGETTGDGMFSVDSLRCVGACGLAPMVMVGTKVYGRMTADDVDGILAEYKGK